VKRVAAEGSTRRHDHIEKRLPCWRPRAATGKGQGQGPQACHAKKKRDAKPTTTKSQAANQTDKAGAKPPNSPPARQPPPGQCGADQSRPLEF